LLTIKFGGDRLSTDELVVDAATHELAAEDKNPRQIGPRANQLQFGKAISGRVAAATA
jgi:hypothetical protein